MREILEDYLNVETPTQTYPRLFSVSRWKSAWVNIFDRFRTPGIIYLSGATLLKYFDFWYDEVETAISSEPHLLPKTRADLEPAAEDHRVVIAVDSHTDSVVGCIVLWDLGKDRYDKEWFELGTFFVKREYRFHGKRQLTIGDVLYRRILAENTDRNILTTSTNPDAIRTGMRHGMQMISFRSLPNTIHVATCVCPFSKTGAMDNARNCKLKDRPCRVRVTTSTWIRLKKPLLLPYIVPKNR